MEEWLGKGTRRTESSSSSRSRKEIRCDVDGVAQRLCSVSDTVQPHACTFVQQRRPAHTRRVRYVANCKVDVSYLGHRRLAGFILDSAGQQCKYFSKIPGHGSSPWYVTCCLHVLSHLTPCPEHVHLCPSFLPQTQSTYLKEPAAKIPRDYL